MARIRITPVDVLVSKYLSAFWKLFEYQISAMAPDRAVLEELKRLRRRANCLGCNLEAETASQVEADDLANS